MSNLPPPPTTSPCQSPYCTEVILFKYSVRTPALLTSVTSLLFTSRPRMYSPRHELPVPTVEKLAGLDLHKFLLVGEDAKWTRTLNRFENAGSQLQSPYGEGLVSEDVRFVKNIFHFLLQNIFHKSEHGIETNCISFKLFDTRK